MVHGGRLDGAGVPRIHGHASVERDLEEDDVAAGDQSRVLVVLDFVLVFQRLDQEHEGAADQEH